MSKANYKNLREWLEIVQGLGELRDVKGASWQEDIGMATEMLHRIAGSPAVLFDEIPGYPKGYRVLVNALRSENRLAVTAGLPLNLDKIGLSMMLTEKFEKNEPIPHQYVETGPVMENVFLGDDVNLLKFPAPIWHEHDGGRYIGTGCYDITRDPDSGWINLGTYRVMLHDEKNVGFYISPGKHGRQHRDKYFARKEPCPVAIVVGGDPLLFWASCTELPYGLCEYDWAGGIKGEAYKVIKGQITGLPIPAEAEIVMEGFAYFDRKRLEGPFGEWTGYYASGAHEEPCVEIKAVYHRNDPILLTCPPNCPPDEQAFFRAIMRSPLLKGQMEKAGIPGIKSVWCHEVGGSRLLVAVAIEQRYPGHATQVGHIASQCHIGAYCGRYVIVVDDDIDVSNLDELMWAVCTRSDPATSIDIIHRAWSTALDPRISPEDKKKGRLWNSRAIIDATKPYDWKDEFPMVNLPSPERKKKALEKWGYLLR